MCGVLFKGERGLLGENGDGGIVRFEERKGIGLITRVGILWLCLSECTYVVVILSLSLVIENILSVVVQEF
jgi:hypothetical protein